jgi:hypothetical protein
MNPIITNFFSDLITKIEEHYKFNLDDYSVMFILRILHNLLNTKKYFELDKKPLAIQYLEALQEPPVKKSISLMNVGDVALISGTLFQEYVTRRELIDIDYLLGLSFTAFKNIIDTGVQNSGVLDSITVVLGDFENIINTLDKIGESINFIDKRDIKKLLKRYDLTGLDFYKKELYRYSIFPCEGSDNIN